MRWSDQRRTLAPPCSAPYPIPDALRPLREPPARRQRVLHQLRRRRARFAVYSCRAAG